MAFKDPKTYDLFNYLTLLFGLWLGVIPLALTAFGAGPWRLAVTLYLPAPLDVIVSALAVVAMFVSFVLLDRSKRGAARTGSAR